MPTPTRAGLNRFLFGAAIVAAQSSVIDVSAQQPVPVVVAVVERARTDRDLKLTGTVTAERAASLSPRVSGLVARVHVDAGDRVAAGRTLVELDAELAKLALERAQAALAEARAQLAENERLHQEAASLVAKGFLPQTRLHAAEAERRVAAAAVERLEAERRQQAEIVRRHSVVAPFAGVVSRKLTDAGEWVQTGTPVLELVDTARLRVDVQVPQEHYRAISVGTPARVQLDAQAGRVLQGKVIARVPVNNPGARTFLARIEVTRGNMQVTPGMSAQVNLALRGEEKVVRVPRDAILRRADGSTSVWVAGEGETTTVTQRPVQIGRSLRDTVDVYSGLDAGVRVVVRGNETLTEGQRVRVLNAAAGAPGN